MLTRETGNGYPVLVAVSKDKPQKVAHVGSQLVRRFLVAPGAAFEQEPGASGDFLVVDDPPTAAEWRHGYVGDLSASVLAIL